MPHIFSADSVFVTILGYDLSYLEFFGTALNLASVWLVLRRNILTWPVGIAAVVLFAVLFYQIELYSDFIEQLYFIVTGFYGWWIWRHRTEDLAPLAIERLTQSSLAIVAGVVAGGTLAMGLLMSNVHRLLPGMFEEPAALPHLDAFTTVMSFAAQLLMAHRKLESWLLWIIVDVIGIGLYYNRGVEFISLLYCVFLAMAIKGLLDWLRVWRMQVRVGASSASWEVQPAVGSTS
jgi:nicotinamide mononucleotide transporter